MTLRAARPWIEGARASLMHAIEACDEMLDTEDPAQAMELLEQLREAVRHAQDDFPKIAQRLNNPGLHREVG